MWRRIVQMLVRIALASAVAVIVIILPPPAALPAWVELVWTPMVVFVLVCYMGKLLYDTFFFDRYLP
jgi:hypothetical protein